MEAMNDDVAAPRLNAVLLAWLAGLAVAFLVVAGLIWWRESTPAPARTDARRVVLADSLARHRALDSAALIQYGRAVERSRGDSLARLLAVRATAVRTRWLPGRLDTLVQRDTVRDSVVVAGADVRTILVADSACIVRADSLAGELVQARYDADQCSEELRKRPTSCNGWSAFGFGAAAGVAFAAAACMAVR